MCVFGCRVEVLPLMLAINSEACTLEAGRRWSVALIRQGGHVEYGRVPHYMVSWGDHHGWHYIHVQPNPCACGRCRAGGHGKKVAGM